MITHPDREHGTAFTFDMHFGDSTVDDVAASNKELYAKLPSGVDDFFKGFNISTLVSVFAFERGGATNHPTHKL